MKLILDIPDQKAPFALEVLRSFSFVKKAEPMNAEAVHMLNDLKAAAKEVREHKAGKRSLKSAHDVLNEL